MAVAEVVGSQTPRICTFPPYVTSKGQIAVELAAHAGLILDPWQQLVLQHALGVRADGKWAAFEVGLMASRQNGKDGILEALSLAALYELGDKLTIHSAHQFDTSLEAFTRLEDLIAGTPDLSSKVKRISRSHGEEGIQLESGHRIRYRTRTKGGGRGFSCDRLLMNEAMVISEMMHGALLPTLSARPNPQVWYTGSAVDEDVHEHGIVFTRIRERGCKGDDPALGYFDWSVPGELSDITDEIATDPESWAQANPGLGIRITEEHVAREQRSMDPRTFAVERLGVGVWPSTTGEQERISLEAWRACIDLGSQAVDPVQFVFDVTPQRSAAAIGVAAKRADGLFHMEIVDHRPGTGWVPGRLAELVRNHRNSGVACDTGGPAAALLAPIANLDIKVDPVNANEYAQACGLLADSVDQQIVRHLGTSELEQAIRGAGVRPLSDAWAWSRKASTVDISPLVAVSIALWRVMQRAPTPWISFA